MPKKPLLEAKVGVETSRFEREIAKAQTKLAAALVSRINREMTRKGLTYAEVAWTLGKRKDYVTRAINAGPNLSIGKLVELAHAVGLEVGITLS